MNLLNVLIPNVQQPLEGVVTGGQPTPEQLEAARDAGVGTVVNLCPAGECGWDEDCVVEELGMRYVSIPIRGPMDITAANAMLLRAVLEEPSAYPLMVHCASGNRVGALFAAKAFYLEGRSLDEALEIGRTAGLTKLEIVLREVFSR